MTAQTTHRSLLLICAAILIGIMAVDGVSLWRTVNNHDFAVYYKAALRLRAGGDIFADTQPFRAQIEQGISTKNASTPWPYAYPPFLAASLLPLSFMSLAVAGMVWTVLSLFGLAVSMWLLLRSQNWLTLAGCVVGSLIVYQYDPAIIALRLGQMDVVIFFLLVLAFWWLKKGHDGRAGLALALAIGFKFFSGFVVVYLLWKRRWRAALVGGVTGALLAFGSFALVGFDGLKSYLDFSSIYTSGPFAGYLYHQSLNAIFTRMFKPNMFTYTAANLPWLADFLTVTISAVLLVGFLWLTRRAASPAEPRFDLEYALALTTLLLVIPPAPRYSFVYLLFGFIVVAAHLVRNGGSTVQFGLFGLAFILSARVVYFPVRMLWRLFQEGQWMMSAIFLWILIGWLLWKPAVAKGDA